MPRARMTRSELKAQDEITTTLERLTGSAMARKNEVLVGVGILVVLVGLFYGWRYYSSSRNAVAQKELATVISAFQDPTVKSEKDRFEKTITAAQKTMADYSSTETAYMALEEGFGIEIPDEDAEKITTVKDALAYIEAHLPKS